MIEVRHLRKNFGAVCAVRDVSFSALDGQITGLLGENGAGKTTTLSIICGLMESDEGTVRVGAENGAPIERRRQIGALLDDKGLYGRLTTRENIEYFGRLHGLASTALEIRVDAILSEFGLEQIADRRTAGFSQGERMKVALGRALVHSPAHVLLDEPTNGLDITSVHALRDLLRRLRAQGVCVVLSSHVLDEIRVLCDQIIIMSRGCVVAAGREESLCQQAQCATLEEAFCALTSRRELKP